MGYTPGFTPQYESGWEDLPSETSPITAEALNAYDDAIENIENYLASDESQANLADAYDETATYSEGDYVIYGGDLYKCLEDIDEPEEWDSTKWESCLITDEMATSGGTNVIANPSGQATDTLTKLQVEETIYGISGGGGNANIWTGTKAEYEAQASQIADGTQVNITDDEERVDSFHTYSTDERIVGEWTDGKPIYEKTYILAKSDISSGESTYTHNDNLNIDTLVNVFGTVTNSRPLVSYHTNNVWATSIYNIGSNAFWLYIGSSVYSGMSATSQIKVTLQYTKTV